jgi:hypothetical protein
VLRWETPGAHDVPKRAANLLRDSYALALHEVETAEPYELGTVLTVPSEINWHDTSVYPPSWYRHIATRIAAKLGKNVLAIEYGKSEKVG